MLHTLYSLINNLYIFTLHWIVSQIQYQQLTEQLPGYELIMTAQYYWYGSMILSSAHEIIVKCIVLLQAWSLFIKHCYQKRSSQM